MSDSPYISKIIGLLNGLNGAVGVQAEQYLLQARKLIKADDGVNFQEAIIIINGCSEYRIKFIASYCLIEKEIITKDNMIEFIREVKQGENTRGSVFYSLIHEGLLDVSSIVPVYNGIENIVGDNNQNRNQIRFDFLDALTTTDLVNKDNMMEIINGFTGRTPIGTACFMWYLRYKQLIDANNMVDVLNSILYWPTAATLSIFLIRLAPGLINQDNMVATINSIYTPDILQGLCRVLVADNLRLPALINKDNLAEVINHINSDDSVKVLCKALIDNGLITAENLVVVAANINSSVRVAILCLTLADNPTLVAGFFDNINEPKKFIEEFDRFCREKVITTENIANIIRSSIVKKAQTTMFILSMCMNIIKIKHMSQLIAEEILSIDQIERVLSDLKNTYNHELNDKIIFLESVLIEHNLKNKDPIFTDLANVTSETGKKGFVRLIRHEQIVAYVKNKNLKLPMVVAGLRSLCSHLPSDAGPENCSIVKFIGLGDQPSKLNINHIFDQTRYFLAIKQSKKVKSIGDQENKIAKKLSGKISSLTTDWSQVLISVIGMVSVIAAVVFIAAELSLVAVAAAAVVGALAGIYLLFADKINNYHNTDKPGRAIKKVKPEAPEPAPAPAHTVVDVVDVVDYNEDGSKHEPLAPGGGAVI